MLISVVLVVEASARRIGIHNAYLDHGGLPVSHSPVNLRH
jgi:hypothetical protein